MAHCQTILTTQEINRFLKIFPNVAPYFQSCMCRPLRQAPATQNESRKIAEKKKKFHTTDGRSPLIICIVTLFITNIICLQRVPS